jgi:hypothetical protein
LLGHLARPPGLLHDDVGVPLLDHPAVGRLRVVAPSVQEAPRVAAHLLVLGDRHVEELAAVGVGAFADHRKDVRVGTVVDRGVVDPVVRPSEQGVVPRDALGRRRLERRVVVQRFRAVALPPFRPAAFFCAVVPPWLDDDRDEPECDFLPPLLEAPGEFAMRAARSFDMPLSFSASYCFSFLTLGRLFGIE